MNSEGSALPHNGKSNVPGIAGRRWGRFGGFGLTLPGLVLFCLLPVSAAAADQLGRLFFSAEERAALEALRSVTEEDTAPPPPEAIAPPATSDIAATELYSLGGIITRQSELQAVWLNEQRYTVPTLPANISQEQRRGPEEILLRVPQRAESYPLRPGQRLDLNNDRVWEAYERGWQSTAPLPDRDGAATEEPAEPQAALQTTSE